jgi:pimeloyl-ACP methyl ester carboxylesterase
MRKIRYSVAIASFAFGISLIASGGEAAGRLELTSCAKDRHEGFPEDARCGIYEVWENRATKQGRKIPLQVVVLPARGADRLPDPIIYLAGGPGDSAVKEGVYVGLELEKLRDRRDILLVDLRGTGMSGGLYCTELQGAVGVQGFLDDFLPTDRIHACRDRLKKEVDLSWYTSDAAVDDLEEVRAALGYGPANLLGGSYGTRSALIYLRRHPKSVRTAILHGVVSPDERYPLELARSTQTALDGLIAECQGDPACHKAFPKLREETAAVLRQVTAEPVRVQLTDPKTGAPVELRLGRSGVAQTVRYMLYSPAGAALVPLQIHLAAQGDWKPLARSAQLYGGIMSSTSDGFYQSVTCAEDIAFIREEQIAPAVAGTFLGDFRVRKQLAACEGWPTRDLGPETLRPVVSDVPVLAISGERDPATPASAGEKVVRTLRRGRHLVIADAAHSTRGLEGTECLTELMVSFIEAGAAEKLDVSCISRIRRQDFFLNEGEPEVKVARADLEKLVGTYKDTKSGLGVRIDLLGDRLRVTFPDTKEPFLLIPTSPTRFRVEAVVGEGLEFVMANGRATGVRQTGPGRPDLVIPREE